MRLKFLALPVLLSLAACVTEATGSGSGADPTTPDGPLVSDNTAAEPEPEADAGTPGSADGGANKDASDGGTNADAAMPVNATVTVDGWNVPVKKASIVVSQDGSATEHALLLELAETPVGATRLSFLGRSVGTMCGSKPNNTLMLSANDDAFLPNYAYSYSTTPNPYRCGLAIEALPTAVGLAMTGTYDGTLVGTSTTHVVKATFSVVRAP